MSLDRAKLVRILGMLGSAHQGESANAAKIATSIIKEAGLTWHDIVYDPEQLIELKALLDERSARIAHLEEICRTLTVVKPKPVTHKERASNCLEFGEGWLTTWEENFLSSFVAGRFNAMTDKQLAILERIEAKLEEKGAFD